MITAFRRYLDTWVVRGFFMIMVAAFIFWGVGDVVRMVGTSTWVAKVAGITIEGQAFQADFQRAMSLATRDLPPGQEATANMRRRVGEDTLQRMIGQAAFTTELRNLRVVTPDAAVLDLARTLPAFQGPDGKFSKTQFDAVLRNNGLSEARFLDMLRGDLAQRQVLSAVTAGAATPDLLLAPLYAAQFEKRSADMAEFAISAAPAPAAPDEAVLRRWYDNHPDRYATPEYRRIKFVELSPRTLASEIEVTDDEARSFFNEHRSDYITLGKRSTEVISVPDEAKAKALADKWRSGADWPAMQAAAQAEGAGAITFDDATETQFPDPELGKAVFAATPNAVTEPIKGALGWFVVRVTKAQDGSEITFEQARDAVRDRVIADRATDIMYDRANKVDNQLANGVSLDDLPPDLGLAGSAGTLERDGNTPDGGKAPIPGATELRDAIIAAAFQAQKGDQPRLTEVQTKSTGGSAYFALTVEDITPASTKPYDTVKDRVKEDWTLDQQRHTQEQAAAAMLQAVQGGRSFSDAATVAGVTPRLSAVVNRAQSDPSMPPELQPVLFTLKKGEPTMVETPDGFVVAIPAEIIEPDPKADAAGYAQARTAITRSIANDISATFTEAIRLRANPDINRTNVNSIIQP